MKRNSPNQIRWFQSAKRLLTVCGVCLLGMITTTVTKMLISALATWTSSPLFALFSSTLQFTWTSAWQNKSRCRMWNCRCPPMMLLPCGESLCGTHSLQSCFVEDTIECDTQRSSRYMIDTVMLHNTHTHTHTHTQRERERGASVCDWLGLIR